MNLVESESFELLINRYIETKVGLVDSFLTPEHTASLRENVVRLFNQNDMHPAGVGSGAKLYRDPTNRGDKIFWLDRKHKSPAENAFLDIIDSFVEFLNRTCYAGITGYEFHYALYDTGTFYRRHIDQFRTDKGREFSIIVYLNENWKGENGGELCIYNPKKELRITPDGGRCVFFKSSELEHEVLMSRAPRMSLTGWLKRG